MEGTKGQPQHYRLQGLTSWGRRYPLDPDEARAPRGDKGSEGKNTEGRGRGSREKERSERSPQGPSQTQAVWGRGLPPYERGRGRRQGPLEPSGDQKVLDWKTGRNGIVKLSALCVGVRARPRFREAERQVSTPP